MRRRRWLPLAVVCAFGIGVASHGYGQFASGVTLVEVYATATGPNGAAVTDLTKSDFQVFEDGVPQTVSAFASGTFPLAVAVAIDRSWSMAGERLLLAKQAARRFLQQLRPADRAMVIAVASDVEVIAPMSTDRAQAIRALDQLQPWSTSALHDALIECVAIVQGSQANGPQASGQAAGGRRALILLSDGIDRYSHATAAEALQRARESDVLLYPIALVKKPSPLFAEVAVQTGGRSFALAGPKELDKTFRAIADELRHQYLLGYSPSRSSSTGQPEWRSIDVKVNRAGLRVRARPGYVAR